MSDWKFYRDWKALTDQAELLKNKEIERVVVEGRHLGITITPDIAEAVIDSAEQATAALGSFVSPVSILSQVAKEAMTQNRRTRKPMKDVYDDFVEYERLAIHTNHATFKAWFDNYLRTKFGQKIILQDNLYIEHERHFQYIRQGELVIIKCVPIAGDDIQLTFFDDPERCDLKNHLIQIIHDIKQKWWV